MPIPYEGNARKGADSFLFCSEKCADEFGTDCHLNGYWKFGAVPLEGTVDETWGDGYLCDNCDELVQDQTDFERLHIAIIDLRSALIKHWKRVLSIG